MPGTWKQLPHLCKKGVGIVSRLIILLIIIPFLTVLYALCWIRIKITAHIYYYKNQSLLSMEDVLPMRDVHHVNSMMNGILLLKGNFSLEAMKELFLSKVLNAKNAKNRPQFPRFTQYIHMCAGYQMWNEETNFNIDDHIRQYYGQLPNNEQELKFLVTDLCHIPLNPLKSGWELIVIPLQYSQSDITQTCIIFRIHHCMADGISVIRLIIEQMAGNHGAFQPILKKMQMKFQPKFKNTFVNMLVNIAQIAYTFIFKQHLFSHPYNQVLKQNGEFSETRYVDWTSSIKMNTLRCITDVASTTVNDVLMSCMAGAFRKYLMKHDICPPDFLTAAIPFAFHDPDDPVAIVNKFSGITTSIPTGDMDCIHRLRVTTVKMDHLKFSPYFILNRFIALYWGNILPCTLSTLLCEHEKNNVAFTNLPIPSRKKAAFNGNTIESFIGFLMPSDQTEFGVTVFTYAGDVTVAVSVNKARVYSRDDLSQLLDYFVEEVQQLYNAVVGLPNKPSPAMEKKND